MSSEIASFVQKIKLRTSLQKALRASPWLGSVSFVLTLLLVWRGSELWHPSVLLFILFCAGGFAAWVRWLQRTPLSEIAHRIERDTEVFPSGYLVASLEFTGSTSRFSQPFAHAVSDETSETVRGLDPADVAPLWPLPRAFYLSALLAVIFLGVLWVTPRRELFTPTAAEVASPVVGDLIVQYEYPKYSKLPTRKIEGLSGVISALKGTRVTLQTRALQSVSAAKIVIDGSDKEVALRVDGERSLSGSFTLLQSGSFRFVIQAPDGEWVAGPTQEMVAEVDAAPAVELISPSTDLEVKELDQLDLEVAVEDDFALRSLRIVFEIEGISTPQTIEVTSFTERKRSFRGVLKQPLEALQLKEGDRVRYFIEALDNDVVSGPKKGTSSPRFLKVFSAKENHLRLIEAQAELVKSLAAHLGSRMEEPFPILFEGDDPKNAARDAADLAKIFSSLSQGAEKLVSVADGLSLSLTDDALAQPEVKAKLHEIAGRLTEQANQDLEHIKQLRASIGRAEEGPISAAKAHNIKAISALEDDVFALDELVKRQRAENVRSIAEELAAAKERLQKLIEEYERTKDPKLKEQIQREIERLEALLKTYQEEVAKMQAEMPEEFFNLEALKADEMKDGLSKAKESIAKGDMGAAKAALSQLGKQLDDAQKQLDEDAARFGDQAQQQRDKEAEQLLNDLSALEGEQRRLLQSTQELEAKARERAELANKAAIDATREEAKKKLTKLSELLMTIDADALSDSALLAHASSVDRVEELSGALSTKGLSEVISSANLLREVLASYQKKLEEQLTEEEQRNDIFSRLASLRTTKATIEGAAKLTEEILAMLQKATPALDPHLTEEDKTKLAELQRGQKENQDKLAPLHDKMKKMGAIFKISEAIEPSTEGKAAAAAPPALPDEVTRLIGELKEAMSGSSDGLAKRQPPPAITFEKTALQKIQELKQLIKNSGKSKPQEKSKKVKIPTAEEFQPPRDYRDEVIEGSKEKDKASPRYQEALKKYYQELLQ